MEWPLRGGDGLLPATMLDALKKWIRGSPKASEGVGDEVEAWARKRQYVYRVVRDVGGFVIEGKVGTTEWRIEWGPSQRPYVPGRELRLRADLGVPADLQVLILNRELRDAMEREVFDQFVEDVQTRIDTTTPPEMRWLVMLPKVPGSELKAVRERYGAVASLKPWLLSWLEGRLSQELANAPLDSGKPLVLMIGRNRLTLRTALEDPDPQTLESWLRLFECAIREAHRTASEVGDSQSPSTQPSLWATTKEPNPGNPGR